MIGPIMGGVARLRYLASNVNVAVFGNSLVAGVGATGGQTFPAQIGQQPPLTAGGVVPVSLGLSGSNIAALRGYLSNVNNLYAAGKTNVLIIWEGTNSICNSGNVTGLAAAAEMKSLIDLMRTGRPWERVIVMTTLPRFGSIAGTNSGGTTLSVVEANAELDAYNAYLKANWRAMGAQGLVDVRAGGIFVYPPGATVCAPGSAMYPYMNTGAEGTAAVHCNNAGYALAAQYAVDVLKRLPAR